MNASVPERTGTPICPMCAIRDGDVDSTVPWVQCDEHAAEVSELLQRRMYPLPASLAEPVVDLNLSVKFAGLTLNPSGPDPVSMVNHIQRVIAEVMATEEREERRRREREECPLMVMCHPDDAGRLQAQIDRGDLGRCMTLFPTQSTPRNVIWVHDPLASPAGPIAPVGWGPK